MQGLNKTMILSSILLALLLGIAWLITHEAGHYIVAKHLRINAHIHFCWKGPYLEFGDEVSLKQLDLVVLGGLLGIVPLLFLLYFNATLFIYAVSGPILYCPIELWWNRKQRADNLKREQSIH